MTLRACLIGFALVVAFGIIVPWNDYPLRNTMLYNNHMPPVVTLVLIGLGLVVNPLLGRFRLKQGELVVLTIMLLGLGGVASSGLMRYLPTYMAISTEITTSRTDLNRMRLDLPDDGDPTTADWQWTSNPEYFVEMPERGGVDSADPEYQHVIGGFLYGQGDAESRSRVDHRRTITYTVAPSGDQYGPLLALGGRVANEYRASGTAFLDLDDEAFGAALKGLGLGETALIPVDRHHEVSAGQNWATLAQTYYADPTIAEALAQFNAGAQDDELAAGVMVQIPDLVTIQAIDAEVVPWHAWVGPFFSWMPLLFGAFLSMIALAGVVRKQWMENERLPYPVAMATMTLLENPDPNRRLPAVFYDKGFWIGLSIAAGIIFWQGMSIYGVVPVQIPTLLNLQDTLSGEPWSKVLKPIDAYTLRVYFSIIALSFFLSLEMSFSLWAFFLIAQFGTMFLRLSGVPVETGQLAAASSGGFFTMCLLIFWIGRKYYLRLIGHALTFKKDPETAEAVPYLWALIIGITIFCISLMGVGVPWDGALLSALILLGFLLVLARFVAEAGIPYVQTPFNAGFHATMMSVVGFGLPPAIIGPMCMVGATMAADLRESLLPYAVNAGFMGKKAEVAPRRSYLLLFAAVLVGIVVAFSAYVTFAYYTKGATVDGWGPIATVKYGWTDAAAMVDKTSTPKGMEIAEAENDARLTSMGIGAVIVGLLGWARMMFTWWPLHPIGFLTMMSVPTGRIWFSFVLGWLFKFGVMRYGGSALYTKLKPFAIGLIAGEAMGAGFFMILKMVVEMVFDYSLPIFRTLPG